jgi:hypothetical protein
MRILKSSICKCSAQHPPSILQLFPTVRRSVALLVELVLLVLQEVNMQREGTQGRTGSSTASPSAVSTFPDA